MEHTQGRGGSLYLDMVCMCVLSHGQVFATPRTIACRDPLSMEFSRQEYWSRLPFPHPGDLPKPGIKLESPACRALVGRFFTNEPSGIWVVPKEFGHFSHPQTAGIRILNSLSAILVAWFLA